MLIRHAWVRRACATAALAAFATLAPAQQKEIKIGFIYDVSGPFAGGGSEPAQIGTKAIVDYFNEKGGVEGYKIVKITPTEFTVTREGRTFVRPSR